MSNPSRRLNQVSLTVMSGLLVAGSSLLIAWGPPPNHRGVEPPVPMSEGGPPSQGAAQPPDSDAAVDALAPANSQAVAWNDPEKRLPARPASDRAATGFRTAPSVRKSPSSLSPGLVTIRHVPVSDSEIETAWKQAARDACELVSPNEPFEITRPAPFLTDTDRRQAARRYPTPGIRQHVLSVGLDMSRQGEQALPALGRHSITDYIHRHYVTIQARVQRDPVSGVAYLHHRPLAATMQFTGLRLTQEFTDTVARSVQDFHSLGIWLRPDEELIAENLRTLVLAHRYVTGQTGVPNAKPGAACELMFIRARFRDENAASPRDRARSNSSRGLTDDSVSDLVLHTFVTSNGRQLLHYIASDADLRGSQQCGIKVLVEFTAFAHGAYPTASVVVGSEVRSGATFSKANLDRFAHQKGWTGSCFDHLAQLLDAIINRELTSD